MSDPDTITRLRLICIRRGQIMPEPGNEREEAIAREVKSLRKPPQSSPAPLSWPLPQAVHTIRPQKFRTGT